MLNLNSLVKVKIRVLLCKNVFIISLITWFDPVIVLCSYRRYSLKIIFSIMEERRINMEKVIKMYVVFSGAVLLAMVEAVVANPTQNPTEGVLSVDVNVVNTAPIPVTLQQRKPFQVSVQDGFGPGSTGWTAGTELVPDGSRLIVEYMSVSYPVISTWDNIESCDIWIKNESADCKSVGAAGIVMRHSFPVTIRRSYLANGSSFINYKSITGASMVKYYVEARQKLCVHCYLPADSTSLISGGTANITGVLEVVD